ncbi:hypothetical protein MVEG_04401 [Podila verticillata NRRL 6337]|nr:hypothetical protein MVEG_04401 [Podila verticillata NRRL 6337]
MTLQVHVHFEKVNTVAPSLLQPSKQLGSRTPMQLVGMSNLKLNREMYSPRSQSMHRRIIIKNFLTMLYQRHPIEWIEDSPVDDKDHWMEQTLSAVGIEEHSDPYQNDNDGDYSYNHNNNNYDAHDPYRSPSSNLQVPDGLLLKPSKVTPLPRPVSGELPQSLHNYLSNVFDVDWSPDANITEDSFYTKSSSRPASTSSPALASQLSQLSFSSTTPPPASWTLATERKTKTPQRTRSFTSNGNVGHIDNSPGSLMREPSQETPRTTNHGRQLQQQEYRSAQATQDPMPQPRPRIRTHTLPNHDTIDYNDDRQAGPGQDANSMQTTPHHYRYDTPQHTHNHIHIHIHNHNHNHSNDDHQDTCKHDPSNVLRDSLKRESVSRSPRYPKSPPMVPMLGSKRGARTPNSSTSSTSISSDLSEGSYSHPRQYSEDSEGPLDYPPREHTFGLYDRPYLAAPFPDYKEQHYPQSLPPPPPPPYSRSPAPAPLITSPPPSPPIMPSDLKISKSNRTRPSEPTLAKLEYQQYQERQKQFARNDQGEDPKAGGALGFIKLLSRQGSKKKATISAPLSNMSSISGPLLLQDIPRVPLQYPVSASSGHGGWSTKAATASSKYTHPSTQSHSPPFSVSSA